MGRRTGNRIQWERRVSGMMGMFVILIVMVSQMHTYVNIKLCDLNMHTFILCQSYCSRVFFF